MAFKEGSAFNGINTNDTEVITNDGSMILFDGLPGSFYDSVATTTSPGSYGTTIYTSGRTQWGGGFDYRLVNANTAIKLTAYDATASDQFGYSVAVGSGVIVSGSPGDDDLGSASGSVYLYNINGTLITKLKASDGAAGDNFGWSVAAGSNRIVVGAPGDDDKGGSSGAAYIFRVSESGVLLKTQQTKLVPSDGAAGDQFGYSVAIGCNRIVVGAPFDSHGTHTGSVYIYRRNGTLVRKITAPLSEGVVFGFSVAINLGRIIVGDPNAKRQGLNSGAVYIYDLEGNLIKQISSTPINNVISGSINGFPLLSGFRFNGTSTILVEYDASYTNPTIPAVGDYIEITGSTGVPSLNGTWQVLSRTTSPYTGGLAFTFSTGITYGSTFWSIGATGATITVAERLTIQIDSYVTNGTTTVTANVKSNSYVPAVGQYFTVTGSTNGGTEATNNEWLSIPGVYKIASVSGSSFTFTDRDPRAAATRTSGLGTATTIDTAGDNFGRSVAVNSGRIAVGVPNKVYHTNNGSSARVVNTWQDGYPSYGIVELYDLNGVFSSIVSATVGFAGTSTIRLIPPSPQSPLTYATKTLTTNAKFGQAVAIGSGYVVCGAPYNTVNQFETGSVFLLNCKTTTYPLSNFTEATAIGYLDKNLISLYPNASTIFPVTEESVSDNFGFSVACGWDTIVIGCPLENTQGGTIDAGAVYVFKIKEKSNGYYEKILDAYGKED